MPFFAIILLNIGPHWTHKVCVVNCGNADMLQIRRLKERVTNVTVACTETSWEAPPVISHVEAKI
jgi:hypothetical protein